MSYVSITKFEIVRGTNRDLVEAAARVLAEPVTLEELLAALPEQLSVDVAV